VSLAIGQRGPDFALPTTSGERVSLAGLPADVPVAVTFWCNHCPYVRAWEDRLDAVARDYAGRLAVVAINANDPTRYPTDSFEDMVQRAKHKGYAFPYAHDESQEVARAYGAQRTPEVFLLDRARRLAYHGAIDDSTEPDQVGASYLRDAFEAVLAGGAPAPAETPPVGCTIKWR
jgi:thiol-disulfide isomerase/thioredoxin